MKALDPVREKVVSYYSDYDEAGRLSGNWGQIEFIRTQEIIRRYLGSPPGVVLDVGGAAGRYACWLAREDYQVYLVDPVPLHIRQAHEASEAQPEAPLAGCHLGDARKLEFEDGCADAVLLLGPFYHLTEKSDRALALGEALRVLKPGGVLFAASISRFASSIDGFASGYFKDPAFRDIMRQDLESGQHRNPTGNPAYFTDTFFHHPDELNAEVSEAGFTVAALLAVEGISYMLANLDVNWNDPEYQDFILEVLRKIEAEPSLIGASPHILCVGLKP